MANAPTEAPSKNKYQKEEQFLKMEFDSTLNYVFELANNNLPRDSGMYIVEGGKQYPAQEREFKPYQNVVLSSQIIWKGQRCNIRYYDGCESIFVSEQPKEKEVIDQAIAYSRPRVFENGRLIVPGTERQLLLYLNICAWNIYSPFRSPNASGIFKSLDTDMRTREQDEKLEKIEKAFDLAKQATTAKMYIHADYLGIPRVDMISQNPRTEKQIRSDYRKYASENPDEFIKSFNDESIEIRSLIKKAMAESVIDYTTIPTKAVWKKGGKEIVDISGIKNPEAILDKLVEFSRKDEGEEFALMIKSIYSEK